MGGRGITGRLGGGGATGRRIRSDVFPPQTWQGDGSARW
jgi:hypothetical protein